MRLTVPSSLLVALLLAGCASVATEAGKAERLNSAALEAILPQPLAAVSLDEIVALSSKGTAADAIIARITSSNSRYRLSATQLIQLRQQGVDVKVLDHIVEGERRAIFDESAAEAARREKACNDRVANEVRQCQWQHAAPVWPMHPFAHCLPPHPGFPYWRCF